MAEAQRVEVGKSAMSPKTVLAREREEQALNLRVMGFTFASIGKNLGITTQGAHDCVKRALERSLEHTAEAAKKYRDIHRQRLSSLLTTYFPMAKGIGAEEPFLTAEEADRIKSKYLNEPEKAVRIIDRLLAVKVHPAPDQGSAQIVRGILNDLARLDGLDAPIKTAETDVEGNDIAPLSDDERIAAIVSILESARARADRQGASEAEPT